MKLEELEALRAQAVTPTDVAWGAAEYDAHLAGLKFIDAIMREFPAIAAELRSLRAENAMLRNVMEKIQAISADRERFVRMGPRGWLAAETIATEALATTEPTTQKAGEMAQKLSEEHHLDEHSNPTGGSTTGTGIFIAWQDGPLKRGAEHKEPNGAQVDDVVQAAIGRLQFFQKSKFSCRENAIALTHLETALLWLQKRTADREERGVEGEHKP